MSETQGNQVELGDRVKGQIELPKLDLSQYIGTRVKIVSVTEHEGAFGYYVKFTTESVGTINTKEGEKELFASRIIGLQEDANGNLGWGAETKMGTFLKQKGLQHYRDAVGMEVVIQLDSNKEGTQFLSFH